MQRESNKEITMNDIETMLEGLGKWWEDVVSKAKEQVKKTETDISMTKKKIQVELPEPPSAGGFAGCPSGDCEYDEAIKKWQKECNAKILEAIPYGYSLKSSEVKEERIVRHYADLIVEKS